MLKIRATWRFGGIFSDVEKMHQKRISERMFLMKASYSTFLKTAKHRSKSNLLSRDVSHPHDVYKVFRCHHGTHNMRSNVKEPRKKMGQVFLFAYKIIEKYKKIPSLVYLPADDVTIIIFMVLMKRTDDRNLKMFIICGAYFNN